MHRIINLFLCLLLSAFIFAHFSFAEENNCNYLSLDLKLGSKDSHFKSQQVSILQRFLSGYFGFPEEAIVSGFFDIDTKMYVMNFQKDQKLVATGVVGKLTRDKIKLLCAKDKKTQGSIINSGQLSVVGQSILKSKVLPNDMFLVKIYNYKTLRVLNKFVPNTKNVYINYLSMDQIYNSEMFKEVYDIESGLDQKPIGFYFGKKINHKGGNLYFTFSDPQRDLVKLYINGNLVHTYGLSYGEEKYSHYLDSGIYNIELIYESHWHAGSFSMVEGKDYFESIIDSGNVNDEFQKIKNEFPELEVIGVINRAGDNKGMSVVNLNYPQKPFVLVLSSYEPIAWKLENFDKNYLKKVFVYTFSGGSSVVGVNDYSLVKTLVRKMYRTKESISPAPNFFID